ncbi:DNA polymerase III subunit delta [Synechocystis sp. LKSZ1]|uniref:DNA polymerase III subunit delta n=1 Tax=Synechocystis sp. LKSZ1 TaxID=3144951 RepID=UPI00336BBE3E
MPVYFYWGEDDFTLKQAVKQLQKRVLDPQWQAFNFEKIPGELEDATRQALTQALTPPFGAGDRLVWVVESTLGQHCSEALLERLALTLPQIPPQCHLLFTSSKKPDGRLKATKLLQTQAQVREFSLIPPWKSDELVAQITGIAEDLGLPLTHAVANFLAEALGNNTRQIWNELEKLKLLASSDCQPLTVEQVRPLIHSSTQSSLQLAEALRQGNSAKALQLVADLLARNEPALKIVATLVGQFRTWIVIKLALESGEKDEKVIASRADLSNPKRLYFIRKELQGLTSKQLLACWPLLRDLEWQLKRGADPARTLQTKVLELSLLFKG